MWLSEDFIYEIIQNNRIEDVMADYVKIIGNNGSTASCLCPFHGDSNPSCGIRIDEQFFNCFTCHAGGNVVTFIRRIENLSYYEALIFLAKRAGMPLPEVEDDNTKLKNRILSINREAARFFYNTLMKSHLGQSGREYFKMRELSPKTITNFGLGYAPYGDSLQNHLLSKGYSYDDMLAAKLVSVSHKSGEIYSFFAGRTIFPIINESGEVIAFGGRIIKDGKAKYKNSAENPIYTKGKNLYALNFVRKSGCKYLILAEGYMDVIALHQAGFTNAVAALGTAFTLKQAQKMREYCDEVVIAYDSDNAGQTSTNKVISLLSQVGVRTRILNLHDAKDPDEYIKKFGALQLKLLIEKSEDSILFKLKRAKGDLNIDIPNDKIKYIENAIVVLSEIKSNLIREVHATNLANECGISKEIINMDINKRIKRNQNEEIKKKNFAIQNFKEEKMMDPKITKNFREYKAECGIIYYIYKFPESMQNISRILRADHFVTDFNKKIYELAVKKSENSSKFSLLSIESELSPEEVGNITNIINKNINISIDDEILDDYIAVLLDYSKKNGNKTSYTNEQILIDLENKKNKM